MELIAQQEKRFMLVLRCVASPRAISACTESVHLRCFVYWSAIPAP